MVSVTVKLDPQSRRVQKRLLRFAPAKIINRGINRGVQSTMGLARTAMTKAGTGGYTKDFLLRMSGHTGETNRQVRTRRKKMFVNNGKGLFWLRIFDYPIKSIANRFSQSGGSVKVSGRHLRGNQTVHNAFVIKSKKSKREKVLVRVGGKLKQAWTSTSSKVAMLLGFRRALSVVRRQLPKRMRKEAVRSIRLWRKQIGA